MMKLEPDHKKPGLLPDEERRELWGLIDQAKKNAEALEDWLQRHLDRQFE